MAKHRQTRVNHQSQAHLFLVKKHLYQGVFGVSVCFAALVLLALCTYVLPNAPVTSGMWQHSAGFIGQHIAKTLFQMFGYVAYLIPFGIVAVATHLLIDTQQQKILELHWALLVVRCCGFLLMMMGSCGLFDILMHHRMHLSTPGGALGLYLLHFFWQGFEGPGTLLILLALWSIGLTWLLGMSWLGGLEYLGRLSIILWDKTLAWIGACQRHCSHWQLPKWRMLTNPIESTPRLEPVLRKKASVALVKVDLPVPKAAAPQQKPLHMPFTPTDEKVLPPLDLLAQTGKVKPQKGYSALELESLSRDLEQHLMDFGISAQVVAVHPGPVITRFELQLGAGTKVSKLSGLAKDIARSLSVSRVRVVEVIPGKTCVGLELPNPERITVNFGDVLNSDVYAQALSPLSLGLGVDIAGHPMVVDLGKMPHLLVAGTTGSGKSVGINSMILSLLFKSSPEEVRMILVDPKMLELSVYDGIPHLLTPVVTDMREAASALRWCVSEMERRYRLMSGFGVRNIQGFNDKVRSAIAAGTPLIDPSIDPLLADAPVHLEPLPFIVVVIDELADMMMVVGKKVEQLIARIAQKARAAGIHLILATQRPSVDVLTGLIKSNIPTRISFQVSSKIDSRTILDQQGAEQLLGYGDMLFLAPGTGAPLRVHGAYVSDDEVHRVAQDWRQRGAPNYIEAITQMSVDFNEAGMDGGEAAAEDVDPLYDQVVEFVVQNRKASISSVQRRFKIGYNRSARLIEEMERVGILGPLEGGMREVLVPENQS